MADRAASSAALRKQWNQRAPGGGHTPAARRSWLGLYGVVLLALVGLLVWWLLQPGQRVYVALLAEKYGPDLAVTEKKEVELLLQPTIDPAGPSNSPCIKSSATLGVAAPPRELENRGL